MTGSWGWLAMTAIAVTAETIGEEGGQRVDAPAAEATRRRDAEQADVVELLCVYREALELAAAPPPSRVTGFTSLDRLLYRLRPTWGLRYFVTQHVRGRVDVLRRRYCLRLALGEIDDNDREDREALDNFAASLPAPASRVWAALPILAILFVSQVLVATGAEFEDDKQVLSKVASILDLNPAHFNDAIDTLLHGILAVNTDVLGLVVLAVYLVLRPVLPAFRLKRMILGPPGAVSKRQARAPLERRAGELAVHDEEEALVGALGMPTPPESALDLWVKAVLLLFVVDLAVYMAFVPPAEVAGAVVFLIPAVLRGRWLLRQRRGRRVGGIGLTSHMRLSRA